MRTPNIVILLAIVWLELVSLNGAAAQAPDTSIFRTERISERVLVLTEISPMENIVVALATEAGLVVVDATGSSVTAETLRDLIVDEFGRDDFAYVIQTHCHWDHFWGNWGMRDATVVAHEGCSDLTNRDRERLPEILSSRREALQDLEARLASLSPDSEERAELEQRRGFQDRVVRGLEGGFSIRDPDITFSDTMTLELGDLSIDLTFFGRAHSGNDILIQVPEEELLLTGDLFLDIGWLPLFAGQEVLDIPRWIEVLGQALDGPDPISRVIPGHRALWPREKLNLWREYIVDLWAGVNTAKARGATLEEALTQLPLGGDFDYLKDLGHTDEALARFHRSNLEAFWRQVGLDSSPGRLSVGNGL